MHCTMLDVSHAVMNSLIGSKYSTNLVDYSLVGSFWQTQMWMTKSTEQGIDDLHQIYQTTLGSTRA